MISGIDFEIKASFAREEAAFLGSEIMKEQVFGEAPFANGLPEFYFEDDEAEK